MERKTLITALDDLIREDTDFCELAYFDNDELVEIIIELAKDYKKMYDDLRPPIKSEIQLLENTPKQKAENLFQLFLPYVQSYQNTDDIKRGVKSCAKIAINEVLHYSQRHGFIGLTEEYRQVKREISLL